jgi:transposase InsO family protein
VTGPCRPKTNGKAERFIKTFQEEWAYAVVFTSLQERNDGLPSWQHIDNRERLQGGIIMKTPFSGPDYRA